ncbi:MAG: L-amino acid N-acyltransferase [Subtercola sp.]|nr:L-amino acid N-acyltransferase [Subtercola sp.]
MLIREATDADLPQLLAIHNYNIEHSTAIWTDTLATIGERQAWLDAHRTPGQLALVATEGLGAAAVADEGAVAGEVALADEVVGYATYGPWRAKEGYRHTVENSVYVRHDRTGQGFGEALMVELIARASEASFHVMIAAIEAGNAGSIRLHERLGFEDCGVIQQVGYKFERWLDLKHMRLQLD